MVAARWFTVIDVIHTQRPCVTFSTFTLIAVRSVYTLGPILTRSAGTLINVNLTHFPSETLRTHADELVDLVHTFAIVEARRAGTLLNVNLTVISHKAWHTDAGVTSYLVQAGGVILARTGATFIYVYLTAGAFVARSTITGERALCVHTRSTMFTWVWPDNTLINVVRTSAAFVSRGAVTVKLAIDRVCVALSSHLARVTHAGIINVTQQASFARGAAADERRNTINAGGSSGARRSSTVIDVLGAVGAAPAVHTHAVVSVQRVTARASILTGVGLHPAFIHVIGAKLTSPFRWALAIVSVYSIIADSSILTLVIRTIIDVHLTVCSIKTWKAVAYVSCFRHLSACSTILARRWSARYIKRLAVTACKIWWAVTSIRPWCVQTDAFILARRRGSGTLIGVVKTTRAVVTRETGTREIPVGQSLADASIGTWTRQTSVLTFTMLTCPSTATLAFVLVIGEQRARPTIAAWVVRVAG